MSKPLHPIEIEKRKPIWKAFSFLYLDTELQDLDYKLIAEQLTESRKPIEYLKEIELFEVFPNVASNLSAVAGVWDEFDEDWLNKQCEASYNKRNDYFYRLKIHLYSQFFKKMRTEHWIEIEKRIELILK